MCRPLSWSAPAWGVFRGRTGEGAGKVMTIRTICKRDGRQMPFSKDKIVQAITKAFNATYKPGREETARQLSAQVVAMLEVEGDQNPGVEHIQDLVERVLMENGYIQTAKAYILYREERSRAREMNTRLMKTYEDITVNRQDN